MKLKISEKSDLKLYFYNFPEFNSLLSSNFNEGFSFRCYGTLTTFVLLLGLRYCPAAGMLPLCHY